MLAGAVQVTYRRSGEVTALTVGAPGAAEGGSATSVTVMVTAMVALKVPSVTVTSTE